MDVQTSIIKNKKIVRLIRSLMDPKLDSMSDTTAGMQALYGGPLSMSYVT